MCDVEPVGCVSERFYEKCSCPDEGTCGIRSVMKEVRDAIAKILENYTVADLCQRAEKLRHEEQKRLDFSI